MGIRGKCPPWVSRRRRLETPPGCDKRNYNSKRCATPRGHTQHGDPTAHTVASHTVEKKQSRRSLHRNDYHDSALPADLQGRDFSDELRRQGERREERHEHTGKYKARATTPGRPDTSGLNIFPLSPPAPESPGVTADIKKRPKLRTALLQH